MNPPHPPTDLSFLEASTSYSQAVQPQDPNPRNRSSQGCFPLQPLQGPGQAGPPPAAPRKRRRITSPEHPAVGDYEPTPGGSGEEPKRLTPDRDPSPTIKFTSKTSAYDIWTFVRAVATDEVIPDDQWPNDYDQHLNERPDTKFVGCKLCTQFGNIHNSKMWKVFKNGSQTSPTTTIRHHFEREHDHVWQTECNRLNVPRKSPKRRASVSSVEPFTQEGLMTHLQNFIINTNQSVDLIESPRFRNLLLFAAQGRVTDDEIPRRAQLAAAMEARKRNVTSSTRR